MRRARLETRERRLKREEGKGRGVDHDQAFLVPVPLNFNYGTECVATTGHVVGKGGGVSPFYYRDLALLWTYLFRLEEHRRLWN